MKSYLIKIYYLFIKTFNFLVGIFPFDIRDFFVFGGIASIWYGTYMISIPVSYIIGGSLMLSIGLLFGLPFNKTGEK